MPKYSIGGIASFVAAFGWRYKQLGLSNIFEGKEVERRGTKYIQNTG